MFSFHPLQTRPVDDDGDGDGFRDIAGGEAGRCDLRGRLMHQGAGHHALPMSRTKTDQIGVMFRAYRGALARGFQIMNGTSHELKKKTGLLLSLLL